MRGRIELSVRAVHVGADQAAAGAHPLQNRRVGELSDHSAHVVARGDDVDVVESDVLDDRGVTHFAEEAEPGRARRVRGVAEIGPVLDVEVVSVENSGEKPGDAVEADAAEVDIGHQLELRAEVATNLVQLSGGANLVGIGSGSAARRERRVGKRRAGAGGRGYRCRRRRARVARVGGRASRAAESADPVVIGRRGRETAVRIADRIGFDRNRRPVRRAVEAAFQAVTGFLVRVVLPRDVESALGARGHREVGGGRGQRLSGRRVRISRVHAVLRSPDAVGVNGFGQRSGRVGVGSRVGAQRGDLNPAFRAGVVAAL